MPKLKINDIEIEVEAGTSLLQAAEVLGFEIPRFCYHDRLSVPANCRMCLVEVKGAPKPVASCAMACSDNMEVLTDSELVKKARKGVMEMLLINHPLDCPICDQGGECDLQDQAFGYGFDRSRYYENKRAVKDKDIGPLVKTVMTRCIQCTRCVRFCDEIAGVDDLGLLNRGENVEIGPYVDKALTTELSGNLIDICPVGALTSKPYAFKARPWELTRTETIDVHDAVGSNIRVDSRGNAVLRILPRLHEEINEEWIDDKTRFACDGLGNQRLDRPWVRDGDGVLRAVTWEEAFSFTAQRLKDSHGKRMAALAGDLCELESMVALKDFMAELGSPHLDCRTDGALYDTADRAGYLFNTTIAGIEDADAILLIDVNPRYEAALLNARIRKTWLDRRIPIGLVGAQADLTYPYTHIGTDTGVLDSLLKGKHDFAAILKEAKNPVVIVGLNGPDAGAVRAAAQDLAEKYGMVTQDRNGFNVLHRAASRVGGLEIGFVPNTDRDGLGFAEILDASQNGTLDVLYLLGADEFDATARIGESTFVIYQGHHGDHGASRADVIFPGAAYTEKDGIYVNMEGRPQLARRAAFPPGEAREDWKILRMFSEYMGRRLPYDTPEQLYARIGKEWPHLLQFDQIMPAGKLQPAQKAKLEKHEFAGFSKGRFYMANAICRASQTMAACIDRQQSDANQMAEAAE